MARTLITRVELARRLGEKPRTITRWLEEGLPVASRGHAGRPSLFNEAQVRAWIQARQEVSQASPADLLTARTRKETALALEAEQRIAVKARRLIPVEEVERTWSAEVTAIRAHLLTWSGALAVRLHRAAAIGGAGAVERELDLAVHKVLTELSEGSSHKRKKTKAPARPRAKPAARRPRTEG